MRNKETEGYFVIKHKNTSKYIGDFPFCVCFVENAKLFETEAKAYKYMERYSLDKECIIEEVK